MILDAFLLMLFLSPLQEECVNHYYVNLTFMRTISEPTQPLQVVMQQLDIGPMSTQRTEAEALRDDVMEHGYPFPLLIPGPPDEMSEFRIAPGALLTNSVRVRCCWLPPFPNGHCEER